jgi:hypothetical protein
MKHSLVALYEFMPLRAPELQESAPGSLSRAALLGSLLWFRESRPRRVDGGADPADAFDPVLPNQRLPSRSSRLR